MRRLGCRRRVHSETEGEAQKQMEADRDEYYKQFISLTYDYSAAEVEARDGYILHGTHRDDIPIETKTVTSSEFKTYNSNGNTIHIPAEAKPAEMMKRRRKALRRMYPALKPPQPTGSMRMLWLRTLNRRCCLFLITRSFRIHKAFRRRGLL